MARSTVLVTHARLLGNLIEIGALSPDCFRIYVLDQLAPAHGVDYFPRLVRTLETQDEGLPRLVTLTGLLDPNKSPSECTMLAKRKCKRTFSNMFAMPPLAYLAQTRANIEFNALMMSALIPTEENIASFLDTSFPDPSQHINYVLYFGEELSDSVLWATVKHLLVSAHEQLVNVQGAQYNALIFVEDEHAASEALARIKQFQLDDWLFPSILPRGHDGEGRSDVGYDKGNALQLVNGFVNTFISFSHPGSMPKFQTVLHIKPNQTAPFAHVHYRQRYTDRYIAICSNANQSNRLKSIIDEDNSSLEAVRRLTSESAFTGADVTESMWECNYGLQCDVARAHKVAFAEPDQDRQGASDIQLHADEADLRAFDEDADGGVHASQPRAADNVAREEATSAQRRSPSPPPQQGYERRPSPGY